MYLCLYISFWLCSQFLKIHKHLQNKSILSQVWWHISVMLALEKLGRSNSESWGQHRLHREKKNNSPPKIISKWHSHLHWCYYYCQCFSPFPSWPFSSWCSILCNSFYARLTSSNLNDTVNWINSIKCFLSRRACHKFQWEKNMFHSVVRHKWQFQSKFMSFKWLKFDFVAATR